jgi:hypothetical protein
MKPHTRKTSAAMPHPFGWRTRTELSLSADLRSLRVHVGDLLRSEEGMVWVTFEGQSQDILLKPGQVHQVAADSTLHASAFSAARLSVIGHETACPHRGVPGVGGLLHAAWMSLQGSLRSSRLDRLPA